MTTENPAKRVNPGEKPPPSARRARFLAGATAVAFLISYLFPLAAGLSKDTASFPKWWGAADVSLAFLLAAMVIGLMAMAKGKVDQQAIDSTYRAYRFLIHGIFALLVVFFLCGDRIVWANCLTGFAWRFWLLLYCLPEWLALWSLKAQPVS